LTLAKHGPLPAALAASFTTGRGVAELVGPLIWPSAWVIHPLRGWIFGVGVRVDVGEGE